MATIDEERLLPWRCFWTMEGSMNNRQGMLVRALKILDPQIGAWVKAERKRIKRIYRMMPPRPLNKDEANKLMMEIFGCNADEAGRMMMETFGK
jgi:hypothetical protein